MLLRDFFFYYLFVIDDYCKATTKTSTFPAVSMELLKNCHVVFPSPEQQQNIVDYLDKKCGEIDKVISAQQKRIALLQELKQSAITHAVTKGLNPNNVEMTRLIMLLVHLMQRWMQLSRSLLPCICMLPLILSQIWKCQGVML